MYALLQKFTGKTQGHGKTTGTWVPCCLYDKHGHFQGEARFTTEKAAEQYVRKYPKMIRRAVDLKIVEVDTLAVVNLPAYVQASINEI